MRRQEEGAGHRLVRLQGLIFEELRALMRDDISDPELHDVRISAVVLSVDYRNARVHFIARNEGDSAQGRRVAIQRALARATPFLRARLAETIDLKRVPDLSFVFDGFTTDVAIDEADQKEKT